MGMVRSARTSKTGIRNSIIRNTSTGSGGNLNVVYLDSCFMFGNGSINPDITNSSSSAYVGSCYILGEGQLYTRSKYLRNKAFIGTGLLYDVNNHQNGDGSSDQQFMLMLGKYNNDECADNTKNQVVVGCGTAWNARANCFATGNDGTNDYIYIGDTKLTEAQLQALLATL